jgi:hypothetical protein
MTDPQLFRHYAQECRRLADLMPEHRTTLLDMARAWSACADAADADPELAPESSLPGKATQ